MLLVVVLFALVTYLAVRLIERRGTPPIARGRGGGGGRGGRSGARPPEPRPLGPDDDPDFLRDLDRKRRHPEDPDA
ncbi:hypothetical protein IBJ60_07045 [Nocardioides sp. zg-578]|uniref:Uncharacterized protein n=1 Tax=Nocardioides marmotae TaxID=2663857 RepID=A0A6I3IYB1_9ACTN|nr:hypothetical protein [Nocardioides marmotae]MCR6030021.1 hypothetical protein [Gordonia jinghuaiqii]MTB84091.1 hypothetical protein [Nocardioides marmotae]MTB93651.1 hypothetical protein [Nocardioides marmotae]QKE03291.1 hypothetical protein HPC71_02075 [Nocardioides marmotae]